MVYKKYIKKDGKIYGPYKYHSRKVNGKVITEYLGKHEEKKTNNILIFCVLGLFIFSFLIFILNYESDSVNLVNSISNVISSSLNSVKTMTGFVISGEIEEEKSESPRDDSGEPEVEEFIEEPESEPKETEEFVEEEIPEEVEEITNETEQNENISEASNIENTFEESISNDTIESTNETSEENITEQTQENVTIENQTISEENKSEIINDSQEVSNETEQIENQIILNQTIPEQNFTETNTTEENITAQIPENITIETNITETISNVSITTIQIQAVIGKPVKWKKYVSLEEPKNLTLKLPAGSKNITVKKIKENNKEIIPSKITGSVIGGGHSGFLSRLFEKIFRLTGGVIGTEETQEDVEVNIEESPMDYPAGSNTSIEYEIEYETPAPQAFEESLERGEKITIVGPENIHYKNVLAFTEIPDVSKNAIKLYRTTGGIKEQVQIINYTDNNENDLIDYIEWIVPHLSEQTYELIVEIYPKIINGAYQFDGVDNYIDIGNDSSLNFGTGDFTVEAWFKLSSHPTDSFYGYPIVQKTDASYGNGWWLWVLNSELTDFKTKLWFGIFEGRIEQIDNGAITELELDTLYHAVGVKGANYSKIYLNGIEEFSNTWSSANSDSTENLLIGTWIDFGSYFNGTIDNVKIFNRSLSTDEVTALYEQELLVQEKEIFNLKVFEEVKE